MRRTNVVKAFCLAALLAMTVSPLMAGAGGKVDPPPDPNDPRVAEMQQAALEEKDLQTQGKVPDRGYEATLKGRFIVSQPMGAERPDVVGEFLVSGYNYAFHVKVLDRQGIDAAVVNKLSSLNGQNITLGGKIRNKSTTYPQGQYFIVSEVLSQPGGAFLPTKATTAPGRL